MKRKFCENCKYYSCMGLCSYILSKTKEITPIGYETQIKRVNPYISNKNNTCIYYKEDWISSIIVILLILMVIICLII